MKLNNFTVSTTTTVQGAAQFGEKRDARVKRMKAFWADKQNSRIYVIGKLLAHSHDGKTLAAHLLEGVEFEMDSINSNGRTLPLQAGFKLSLKTLSAWGCPVCKSAHGTGVHPSPKQDADLLSYCKFFYNPQTKSLFTISDNCWSDYVKGLGVVKQFTDVPTETAADKTKVG
jgi:hypothetical protein